MLLRRLVDYARRDPDNAPFRRRLQFHWELALDDHGSPQGIGLQSLVQIDEKGRARGSEHTVPAVARTVGVAPNLAADDIQYVLGWADPATKPDRVAKCHTAFVDLTRRWAESPDAVDDPLARAVDGFYRSGAVHEVARPEEFTAKQRVLITVNGRAAYRADSAVSFWSAEVARRKGGGTTGLCLVCGTVGPLLDTVPGKIPARLVPGATNDAALISVNERVFGYDLTTKLGSSPICLPCGESVTTGLIRVLESSDTATLPGQNSTMAWWVTTPVKTNPMTLTLGADPAQVATLISSVRHGRRTAAVDDTTKFCALALGGNVARVMVRDWLELPLDAMEDNIAAWFLDHTIAPRHQHDTPFQPMGTLVKVTGRWLKREKRYAFLGAKGADRPDGVHRDLLRAAMRNTPLPPSLLAHLVNRVRTDGRLDTPRAALIRLALLRNPATTEKPMPGLDPTNTNPSYVSGRLFATLESLQYDASGGTLNTTYADRYFAGAVTNPRSALISGRKDAKAWLRKLRRTKPGAGINHEKTLDSLFELLDADTGIPGHAGLRQQALFLLGYHHQRAHRFTTIQNAINGTTEEIPA
ncbi:type I-C CRISPR-associated protein Cas8c/Csd1 [Umezawaea sp. Da 62-37]|uniref:type I-C CRISPR-associated protein Cas8c/Csd1 n=1 Tax=Umezawaea sp. Da 62-37 TaxID=3075927 RepID=UPI0028F72D08|nr:type I-C CRISPR-associated protein Cas8c/Csd1 [Umezawaea sp. Da 62-37]WNV84906.1 type I-C CRISPR-associated protein Cas8c/Csd1 [Umezawaea sp. Da 62-37]